MDAISIFEDIFNFIFNLFSKNDVLEYVKENENAFELSKASESSIGYDIKSPYDYDILPIYDSFDSITKKPRITLINTEIRIIKYPRNSYGRIAPRSGIAISNLIDIGAGVIDPDYTGVVKIILFNFSKDIFKIKRGDKIAQLICEKAYYPIIKEKNKKDIPNTKRGENGFGSSGR